MQNTNNTLAFCTIRQQPYVLFFNYDVIINKVKQKYENKKENQNRLLFPPRSLFLLLSAALLVLPLTLCLSLAPTFLPAGKNHPHTHTLTYTWLQFRVRYSHTFKHTSICIFFDLYTFLIACVSNDKFTPENVN